MLKIHEDFCNCIDNKKSVFGVLSEAEREYIKKFHYSVKFNANEIIFREGDTPNALISLSDGKVKIFKEGVGGREQIVRLAKPVGFIGYRALFAGENYLATAVTIEPSVVCYIERDPLIEIVRKNSVFAMSIIASLARELGFANSRCVTLTQKHVRGRLAEAILFLKDTYGFEEDNCTIRAYLSREDLAGLSNMTTSNAIRTLSQFANENIIELKRRRIKILNLKKLEKICDQG